MTLTRVRITLIVGIRSIETVIDDPAATDADIEQAQRSLAYLRTALGRI